MPDDGSGYNDKNGRRETLVERAMQSARLGRKSRASDTVIRDARDNFPQRDDADLAPADRVEATKGSASDSAPPVPQALPNVGVFDPNIPGTVENTVPATPDQLPEKNAWSQVAEIDLARMQQLGFIAPNQTRTRTTEEFRLIKRAVLQRVTAARTEGRRNPNIIMVTSAGPSEGKTFNAINLAISIASEPDLNVLLIDADLINPSVFRSLGVEPGPGLIDLIEKGGEFNLSDYMVRTNLGRLTLLGAGTPHPMATELMASERMRNFVDEVSQRYNDRIVVFDAPPILATSEASVLTEHMSQIVFIVEADRTSRNQAKEALDMIGNGPSVGIVLNKASSRFGSKIMSSYYKSYSKS